MRTALHVAGMFVLGALCLLAVGVLFEARVVWKANRLLAGDVRPIEAEPRDAGRSSRGTSGATTAGLDAVVTRVAAHLDRAADALDAGRRTAATPRLDTARHLARVLHDVTGSGELEEAVERTRRALQNGHPARAAQLARRSAADLTRTAPRTAVTDVPGDLDAYRGAVVLDEAGRRIGRIVGTADGEVEIEQGGLQDLLGFLTLRHGTRRRVAADRLIFGRDRRIGSTLVIETEAGV